MKRFLVLLFPGFEEIEAFVPIDLLRRSQIEVVTASIYDQLKVSGAHSIIVCADETLCTVKLETFDGLFIPGGPGVFKLENNTTILETIQFFYHHKKWLAAICAAPILLESAGCLPKHFTAHACVTEQLIGCDAQKNVVVDENVITGRGPGAVFPFTFELIERLTSSNVVLQLKTSIHYEK